MSVADYKFLYVNIECNGRVSDGGVFGRSALGTVLNDAEVNLPPNEKIGDNRLRRYAIVADDAFPLEEHIMKPYPYNSKEKEKKIFNYRLSRARQTIEHAFGILCNRLHILQTTIHLRPEKDKKNYASCLCSS